MSEAEVLAAALALPIETRTEVILRLVDSLDQESDADLSPDEWEAAALNEVRKRRRALQNGQPSTVPAAEALRAVKTRLSGGG